MDHSADLMRALLRSIRRYISNNGTLNSDGRRLLKDIVREIAKNRKELMKIAKKARKDPSLENIMRLAEELLGDEANVLFAEALWGPEEGLVDELFAEP